RMKKTQQERLLQRLKEIQERGILRREAEVGAIDVDARTVELSFSSEIEYERWFGIEVLGHDAHEVDLTRLNNDAAVLWMHNWDDQRGVVVRDSAHIGTDRKGRCIARYSRSAEGEKLFQDIVDGIVTKVSVGYSVNGMKLVEERDDIDVYRVTSWAPYEVSNVSVPADDTVGVGRSAEIPQEEKPAKPAENSPEHQSRTTPKGIQDMEKILRDASGNLVRALVDEAGNITKVLEVLEKAGDGARSHEQRGADTERARVRELTELGKAYGATEKALQFIADGKTAADLQRELLADFAKQRAAKPMADQVREAEV
ncbi:HK97 family phage prohead protease, partial [Klebsiella pneumoniae]|uniref:HK97 family phage prohead protease n=1 Tax=Klebsiella pneumoniae TaxID=573 RepID=UPI001E304D27